MRVLASILLLGLLAAGSAERKSYAGYKVLETEALDSRTAKSLFPHTHAWDFLIGPSPGRPARILVAPGQLRQVQRVLDSQRIAHSVIVADLQRASDEHQRSQDIPQHHGRAISFNKFNRLAEINEYLDELAAQYPELVTVQSIGNSTEGRAIKIIKISSGGAVDKPTIFLEGTIHAREWIAPPVALYTIYQLVENYTANRALVDSVDWYIIPVLNVDGYEYTHTTDRYWRKTRSDTGNPACVGVDGNRNFGFHWNEDSYSDACDETFSGKTAFSEPETRAVSDFATPLKDRIKLYMSLHSCSSVLLYPWAYTAEPIEDEADLKALGDKAMAALEAVRGSQYQVGPTMELMYAAPGVSHDWAKGTLGVKYSYTIELPCGGPGLFDPPPSDIVPVVTETFEALRVFGEYFGSGGQ